MSLCVFHRFPLLISVIRMRWKHTHKPQSRGLLYSGGCRRTPDLNPRVHNERQPQHEPLSVHVKGSSESLMLVALGMPLGLLHKASQAGGSHIFSQQSLQTSIETQPQTEARIPCCEPWRSVVKHCNYGLM